MRIHALTLIIGAGLCLAIGFMSPSVAQCEGKSMTLSADDAFFLPGLGAVIMADEKYLKINMLPSSENMPKEFHSVDLKEGDLILMLNGKRMKSIADLREGYETLAVADSVQFGIKRGDQMHIASYLKPEDQMQGGGHRVMMMTSEGPPPEGDGDGNVTKVMTMGGDSKGGNITKVETINSGDGPSPILAMEAGVLFIEKDGGVDVMMVVGNAPTELTGGPLKEGDRLVSCQGEPVSDGEAFRKQFESIKVGTTVTLVYTRDGGEHTVSFAKAKPQNMMMKKSG